MQRLIQPSSEISFDSLIGGSHETSETGGEGQDKRSSYSALGPHSRPVSLSTYGLSADSMNSSTLIKLLTHLLIISSCCLIQSKDITSSLDSKSDNTSAALFAEKSAQSCNNGLGRLVYEKISDHKLSAGPLYAGKQSTETISRTGHPIKVLEECVRRCQEDKMTSIDQCHSFDFAPGRRRSSKYKETSLLPDPD